MAKLYNLVRVETATTGTGTITLGAAVSGFLTFAQGGASNGETITYSIRDGANSEIGRGVYTSSGTTLTRSVLKSTNSNAAINLSGNAEVMISAAAEDFVGVNDVTPTDSVFLVGDGSKFVGESGATARASLGVRDVLTANRDYYVRTDGSDSNTGLANTSGGAFLTIQKALDVSAALDSSIYGITINVAAGTYATAQALKPCAGGGFISVVGAGATTIIDPPAGVNHCFQALAGGRYSLTNMKLQKSTATTGHALYAEGGSSLINFSGIEFGAMNGGGGGGRHIYANRGAAIAATGAYSISGGALHHFAVATGGVIFCNQAVTLTGTPAFTRFADASLGGTMRIDATYSGSATGVRYLADTNGVIYVVGGGASFLPGNSAGSVTNGGQYV